MNSNPTFFDGAVFKKHTKTMRKCIGFCILLKLHDRMQKYPEQPQIAAARDDRVYLVQQRANPIYRRSGILRPAKGGDTNIALAAGTKTRTGRCNDTGLMKQLVEELPGIRGRPKPEVGSVDAAIDGKSCI